MLVPGSLALITASFPEETRGQAIGTWSGFSAITAAIGPVIGGWLIEHSTWRWVFFLNLPLALAVILLSAKVPESRNENASHHLDWLGALLVTLGLGGVTYALIEWPARARHGGYLVAAAAVLGGFALTGFVAVEHWSHAPMVSLKLFRTRNFAGANLLTLFLYASLGGLMFFFPIDLIQIQHYTATQAGAAFLPFIALWITNPAHGWTSCCCLWDRALRNSAAGWELLGQLLPGSRGDGSGHDHQCRSLDYDSDERCT